MEDRLERDRAERPGIALTALVAILAITAAWWALAFYSPSAADPEWLARTRSACFGSANGGLPDAGGWILLIGEPIGMAGVLFAVWGRDVRRDMSMLRTKRWWQIIASGIAALMLIGIGKVGMRVARVAGNDGSSADSGLAVRLDREIPSIMLTDQRGDKTSLASFRGQTAILTFAFGHCSTVCPSTLRDLRAARRAANRPEVPLVVITLDPWRDTPDRLSTIAEQWEFAAGDRILSGDTADVERALDELGIGRRRNDTTGDIEHLATVMILDRRGRIAWQVEGGTTGIAELLRRSR